LFELQTQNHIPLVASEGEERVPLNPLKGTFALEYSLAMFAAEAPSGVWGKKIKSEFLVRLISTKVSQVK